MTPTTITRADELAKAAEALINGSRLWMAPYAAHRLEAALEPALAAYRAARSTDGACDDTAEARFLDMDIFLNYVQDSVNPERKACGLECVGRGAASHLYAVITEKRYRAATSAARAASGSGEKG